MSLNAFTVISEFKFDVANAIIGTEKLQGAVDGLSGAADSALASMTSMSMGFAAQMSGASGGVVGLIYNAISASDKFKNTQIEIANAMTANGMTMGGQVVTFNQALSKSGEILDHIVEKSREFGLSPTEFTSQVKFYNNMLAPKGLAGDNLANSTELARVSMKAAPALGVNSEQATSGIMAGISGQLSANTQFGTRLFMEAGDKIVESTGIKNLKEFNKASPEKRIKALIVGLDKLAGSAETVAARANTFSNRLSTLKDLFYGVGSILKPLGDTVMPLILKVFDYAINYLKTKGAYIIKLMAAYIKPLVDEPEKMIKKMMDLSDLGKSFKSAAGITGLILSFAHL